MNESISHLNERDPENMKVRLRMTKKTKSYYLYQQRCTFLFRPYGYYGPSLLSKYVFMIPGYDYAHNFACIKVKLHECYDLM